MSKSPLTYAQAGVDIEQADAFVTDVKEIASQTQRAGVLSGVGGFGALFELPMARYKNPVMVSSTDGVGTKLKLATQLNIHDTIGIDLVAMCVNDLICQGAEPLFFLDYLATSQLNPEQSKAVLTGIAQGCQQANAALVGGETAEMPGMYQANEYDLAGFSVGIVEKSQIIDGSAVQIGDALIALGSSGIHSNGYSLVRAILEQNKIPLDMPFAEQTLGEVLLTPTRIYVKSILTLLKHLSLHAIAHITGGGLADNLARVLPANTQALISTQSWQWPEIFQWLQQQGQVDTAEMQKTFNLGIGMVLCVAKDQLDDALTLLKATGENAWLLGHIQAAHDNQRVVLA